MPNDNDDKVTLHWEVICRVLNPDEREPLHHPLQIHKAHAATLLEALTAFKEKVYNTRDLCDLTHTRRMNETAWISNNVGAVLFAVEQLDREEEDADAEV